MNEKVVVALIGAAGVVIAAIVGRVGKKGDSHGSEISAKNVNLKQSVKGDNNTQIGIQIKKNRGDKDV